jgi:hypothetical protein
MWGSRCLCNNSMLALTICCDHLQCWHPLFVCLGVETTMLWIPQCYGSDHYVSALREMQLIHPFHSSKVGPVNNYLTNHRTHLLLLLLRDTPPAHTPKWWEGRKGILSSSQASGEGKSGSLDNHHAWVRSMLLAFSVLASQSIYHWRTFSPTLSLPPKKNNIVNTHS